MVPWYRVRLLHLLLCCRGVCGNELCYKLWALIFLFVSVVLIQYQCASRGRVKKVMFVGFFLG